VLNSQQVGQLSDCRVSMLECLQLLCKRGSEGTVQTDTGRLFCVSWTMIELFICYFAHVL